MAIEMSIPSCLGEITRWYCEYCSVDCRLAALCTLLAVCESFKSGETVPPYHDIADEDHQ